MNEEKPEFKPRDVVKFVVTTTINYKMAAITRRAIANHTTLDVNYMPVMIVGAGVGMGVSELVKPYTDMAVDMTADFLVAKRAERKAKKSEKTETKVV
jgi:uncharacterized membrane protein